MSTRQNTSPCVLCGAVRWTPLPDPGPQSMASDWRIVGEPLARHACDVCGMVRRWPGPAADESLYADGYALYAHAPGETRERARQAQYAGWIASLVQRLPARVLDVGCGNGSLLLALGDHWPAAHLTGCDPSAESVAHGAPRLRLWRGTSAALRAEAASDLVVSVNVIEHTHDPLAFLRDLRRALTPDGMIVVVCPDGGRPNLELLFADHVFSFAPDHLRALCARAGLAVHATATAPAALGPFQAVVSRRGPAPPGAPPAVGAVPPDGRARYLDAWRRLDARLLERVGEHVVCFGAGEAAGLLRAYAPGTWARVRACTIDGAVAGSFGELPIVALTEVGAAETVLLGVRPLDQRRVAERLRRQFPRVAAWYDLLDGGDGGW